MYVCVKFKHMKKISKELVGASSIPIILTILSSGESYGYEIIQKIKEISEGQLEWGEGTLYPVLHKLEKKGIIESTWRVADTGRKRKYYRLSQAGKKELQSVRADWSTLNSILEKLWNPQVNLT